MRSEPKGTMVHFEDDALFGYAAGETLQTGGISVTVAPSLTDARAGRPPRFGIVLGPLSWWVERAAATSAPVFLTGETGTGKSHLARAIHARSPFSSGPFVSVNCAALPDALFEAELFGAERGAYTGAVIARPGLVEAAAGGTLLLDEIGELSPAAQAKLLGLLDDGEYRRLGSARATPLRTRILAATNVDLACAVAHGRFRLDLYHRLDVLRIHVPPLRERRADLPALVDLFVRRLHPERTLADGEIDLLRTYDWPGNVRELRSAIERANALDPAGPLSPSRHVRAHLGRAAESEPPLAARSAAAALEAGGSDVTAMTLAEIEKRHVLQVLATCRGSRIDAARKLGIGVSTLRRKLASWGHRST